MQENLYQDPLTVSRKPNRLTRLSALTGAGLLATLLAAGLGGVASAQTVVEDGSAPTEVAGHPVARVMQSGVIQVDDATEDSELFESSPEDEAVWERFEQCLTDAGLDVESEWHAAEPDEATIDAAFDQCDPILDGLSEDAQGAFGDFDEEFGDLSEADEAVFGRYDECLTAGGIDDLFEGEAVEGAELDEAAIDAVFDQCDPILDGLSEDAQEAFADCPEDDEHDGAAEELEGADA